MKKTLLLSTLIALAACDMNTPAARHDCDRLNYAKGTPEYQHCMIDMKNAEDLDSQNKANMK